MLGVYLILSYILSATGYLLYKIGIQRYGSPFQRKLFLYALLGLSLIMPAFIIPALPSFQFETVAHSTHPFYTVNNLEIEEELAACYNLAITETEFCNCKDLEQGGLLLYKDDPVYDSFQQSQSGLLFILGGVSLLIILSLLFKIYSLSRIVKRSHKEARFINGKKYYILDYQGDLLAASFRLFRKYIIWKPVLYRLSEPEQEAVMLHEIAHLRNRDTWELIGLYVLQAFWFLNPVFYILKKEFALLNEFLADAFAVDRFGDRAAYASLLIKLKEQQKYGALSHFGANSLRLRVLELLQPSNVSLMRFAPFLLGLCGLLITTGSVCAPSINQQKQAFDQYCYIQLQSAETGRSYFCKSCLYKGLEERWGEPTCPPTP